MFDESMASFFVPLSFNTPSNQISKLAPSVITSSYRKLWVICENYVRNIKHKTINLKYFNKYSKDSSHDGNKKTKVLSPQFDEKKMIKMKVQKKASYKQGLRLIKAKPEEKHS